MIILKRRFFFESPVYGLRFRMLIKRHGAAVGFGSKWWRVGRIIKKDRFKMAAVVGLSTSLSKYFVRMECI